MKELTEYLPPVFKELEEIKEIARIEGITLEAEWEEVKNIISDQWIEIATERGIERREKMLGIQPFSDESLEDRRFKILSKWNKKLPYTYRGLEQLLNALCGADGYVMELKPNEYSLDIKIELKRKRMLNEVQNTVQEMIPANLILMVSLKYNQYKDLKKFRYGDLKGRYTYKQLREEVLV